MATYKSKGKICYISEMQLGTSRNGNQYARMTIALEVPGYQGTTTRQVFSVFGDDCNEIQRYTVGDEVEVQWTMYAREYNGRWYNNVDLYRITKQDPTPAPAPAKAQPAPKQEPVKSTDLFNNETLSPKEEDLPF